MPTPFTSKWPKPKSEDEFRPFGSSAYVASQSALTDGANRYRYQGKERDLETGLDYYGYRYLCSWLGRWTCPDPGGTVDGLNLMTFVGGDPVGKRDVDGRFDDQSLVQDGQSEVETGASREWRRREREHTIEFDVYSVGVSERVPSTPIAAFKHSVVSPEDLYVTSHSRSLSVAFDDSAGTVTLTSYVYLEPRSDRSGRVDGATRYHPPRDELARLREGMVSQFEMEASQNQLSIVDHSTGQVYAVDFQVRFVENAGEATHVFGVYRSARTVRGQHDPDSNAARLGTGDSAQTGAHELGHSFGFSDAYPAEDSVRPIYSGLMGPKQAEAGSFEHSGGFSLPEAERIAGVLGEAYGRTFRAVGPAVRDDGATSFGVPSNVWRAATVQRALSYFFYSTSGFNVRSIQRR